MSRYIRACACAAVTGTALLLLAAAITAQPVMPAADTAAALLLPALGLVWAAGHLLPHGPRPQRSTRTTK